MFPPDQPASKTWFNSPGAKEAAPYVVVLSILITFIVDLLTPRGVSDWMLYIIPIIFAVTLWYSRALLVAIICTVLTVIGHFLSPEGASIAISVANRIAGIIVLWTTTIILMYRRKAAEQLRETQHKMLGTEQKRTDFMADVSHELRTPLAVIKSTMDLATKRRGQTPFTKKMVGDINGEIARMAELMSELTVLAKPEAVSKRELTYEPMDLQRFMQEIISEHAILARTKHIAIHNLVPPVRLTADKKKLKKMFGNLLTNAIRYGKENGWVRIAAREEGGFTIIEFTDNGIGIREEDRVHIFDRFYRSNIHDSEGVGLGLAICKLIAELHDGTITVASSENHGSVFSVRLPHRSVST